MKRLIIAVVMLIGLLSAQMSFAAAPETGLYVSGKLVGSLAQAEGHKAYLDGVGSISLGSGSEGTFGASVALGYDFAVKYAVPIRAELEYGYNSEFENGKTFVIAPNTMTLKQSFQIHTFFVNAYWDIETGTALTPYIGAGLGLGLVGTKGKVKYDDGMGTIDSATSDETAATTLAWNIGAGVSYDLTENVALDAGYRFVGLSEVKTESYSGLYGKADSVYQHQFALGLRYSF